MTGGCFTQSLNWPMVDSSWMTTSNGQGEVILQTEGKGSFSYFLQHYFFGARIFFIIEFYFLLTETGRI